MHFIFFTAFYFVRTWLFFFFSRHSVTSGKRREFSRVFSYCIFIYFISYNLTPFRTLTRFLLRTFICIYPMLFHSFYFIYLFTLLATLCLTPCFLTFFTFYFLHLLLFMRFLLFNHQSTFYLPRFLWHAFFYFYFLFL